MIRSFKNKYVLTTAAFAVWLCFFDDRDLITTQFRQPAELRRLEKSRDWYQEEIRKLQQELAELRSNPRMLEKYARERYRMKRDDEDLFIISGEPEQ